MGDLSHSEKNNSKYEIINENKRLCEIVNSLVFYSVVFLILLTIEHIKSKN